MNEKIPELEKLEKELRFDIDSHTVTNNGIYICLKIAYQYGQIYELEKANKKMEAERVTKG